MKAVRVIGSLLFAAVLLLTACTPTTTDPQVIESVIEREVVVTQVVEIERDVVVTQVVEVEVDSAAAVHGGTLIVTVPGIVHLDVNSVNQIGLNQYIQTVYETLYERVGEEILPLLAESTDISDDGLTHTIKIYSGVTFHDGTPLTAEIVKWNFDRKINENLPLAGSIPFESISVVDDYTIEIILTRPFPPLYGYLSTNTFSMYSPDFVERVGSEGLKSQANGTGPFKVTEYVPNEKLILEKNENYWQAGLPYLDGIDILIVSDNNTRAIMLQSGDAHVATELSIQDTDRFKLNNNISVWTAPSSRYYYVSLTTIHEPLTEKLVRQALNYAVDKEAMAAYIFLNYLKPARAHIVTEAVEGWKPNDVYPYDPEKAMELMDQAGFVDTNGDGWRDWNGQPVELAFRTRTGVQPGDIETAESIQGYLADVGVNVRIDIVDTATFLSDLNQPIEDAPYYDMVNLSWGTFTGDGEYSIRHAMLCDAQPGTYWNYPNYCNPRVDELYAQGNQVATLEERNKFYEELLDIVWDDAISIFLFEGVSTITTRSNVMGLYPDSAQTIFPFKWAWLSQ
jgi:peptide/nickel transport system substrate-binding protein